MALLDSIGGRVLADCVTGCTLEVSRLSQEQFCQMVYNFQEPRRRNSMAAAFELLAQANGHAGITHVVVGDCEGFQMEGCNHDPRAFPGGNSPWRIMLDGLTQPPSIVPAMTHLSAPGWNTPGICYRRLCETSVNFTDFRHLPPGLKIDMLGIPNYTLWVCIPPSAEVLATRLKRPPAPEATLGVTVESFQNDCSPLLDDFGVLLRDGKLTDALAMLLDKAPGLDHFAAEELFRCCLQDMPQPPGGLVPNLGLITAGTLVMSGLLEDQTPPLRLQLIDALVARQLFTVAANACPQTKEEVEALMVHLERGADGQRVLRQLVEVSGKASRMARLVRGVWRERTLATIKQALADMGKNEAERRMVEQAIGPLVDRVKGSTLDLTKLSLLEFEALAILVRLHPQAFQALILVDGAEAVHSLILDDVVTDGEPGEILKHHRWTHMLVLLTGHPALAANLEHVSAPGWTGRTNANLASAKLSPRVTIRLRGEPRHDLSITLPPGVAVLAERLRRPADPGLEIEYNFSNAVRRFLPILDDFGVLLRDRRFDEALGMLRRKAVGLDSFAAEELFDLCVQDLATRPMAEALIHQGFLQDKTLRKQLELVDRIAEEGDFARAASLCPAAMCSAEGFQKLQLRLESTAQGKTVLQELVKLPAWRPLAESVKA